MRRFRYFDKLKGSAFNVRTKCKIIILCIVLVIGILVLMPSVASVDSDFKFPVSIKSSGLFYDDIEFIPIEATSHENYGKEVGEKFLSHLKLLKYLADKTYDENKVSIAENLTAWQNDSNFTDFIDELEGIRYILDKNFFFESIPLGKVVNIGQRLLTISDSEEKCTTTAATGTATSPINKTFLHQNLDNPPIMALYFYPITGRCYIAKIEGEYNYAFWQIPIFNEFVFVNEKGLGFGGNGLTLDTNLNINTNENLTAMPSQWLARSTMMECERVVDPVGEDYHDVEDLWRDSDRASGENKTWPHGWDNQNNIWCDRFGGILAIEQMNDYFVAKTENPTWPDNPDIL